MVAQHLMLIASKNNRQTELKVKNIVFRTILDDIDVSHIWIDPKENRRAVALIDLHSSKHELEYHGSIDQSYVLAWTEPARSLLVKTHGVPSISYGVEDKLRMLFTIKKRGGSPVQSVHSAKDHYEIVFKNGWDAVQKACGNIWTVGGKPLTVLPFFPCFQEDLDIQILSLQNSDKCISAPKVSNVRTDGEDNQEDSQHTASVSHMEIHQLKQDSQFPLILPDTNTGNSELVNNKTNFGLIEDCKNDMNNSGGSQGKGLNTRVYCEVLAKPETSVKCMDGTFVWPENSGSRNTISSSLSDTALLYQVEKDPHIGNASKQNVQPVKSSSSYPYGITSLKKTGASLSSLLLKDEETIRCNNAFLGWLLSEMEYGSNSEISIIFDTDNLVLLLQSEGKSKDAWHAAIQQECYHSSKMPNHEETFLIQMKSIISLGLTRYKIILSTDGKRPQLFISETENQTMGSRNVQMPMQDWIASLIKQKSFSDIPEEWIEDDTAYKNVKQSYTHVKIVVCEAERKIVLLTLSSWGEEAESLVSAAREIRNLLILSRKPSKPFGKAQFYSFDRKSTAIESAQAIASQDEYEDDHFTEEPIFHRRSTNLHLRESTPASPMDDMPYKIGKEIYPESTEKQDELQATIGFPESKSNKIIEDYIKCPNIFLGWLLSEMNNITNSEIKLKFYRDTKTIVFQSDDEKKEVWQTAIEKECRHGSHMLDYEESFLMQMSPVMKSDLLKHKLMLSGDEERPQLLVTESENVTMDSNDGQMSMTDWIASLVEKKTVQNIPEEWLKDSSAYEEVQTLHRCVKIVVLEAQRKMVLLTLSWEEAKKTLEEAEQDIITLLNLWRIKTKKHKEKTQPDNFQSYVGDSDIQDGEFKHENEREERQYQTFDNEDKYVLEKVEKPVDRFVSYPAIYMEFFKRFLGKDLKAIESKYPSLEIEVLDQGFKIKNSYRIRDVENDISSLKRQIKCVKETFDIPGLVPFLRSEGKHFLNDIPTQFNCLVYFPERGQEYSGFLETLELTSTCYNGTLLGTARHGQNRIHLVQGKLTDVDLDMIVDISISSDVPEAKLVRGQTSKGLSLYLPEWASPNGFDCHKFFSKHREKLLEALQLLFQQAVYMQCKKVVISTNGMRKTKNNCASFPVEDFAKAFVIALRDAEVDDIYICETSSPVVFKAFEYTFARNRMAFRTSMERDWEVLESEETLSVPDYASLQKTRHISVHIASQSWLRFSQDELTCFPAHVNVDRVSIPYVSPEDQKMIESRIYSHHPDGLLPGQAEFVLLPGRKVLIYFCSPWGFDAQKTLDDAMKNCFQMGANSSYGKIRFIPPFGYPEHFVAQKVFQHLDSVVPSMMKHSQITILVENDSKKKPYDELLKRRNPEQKGFLRSICKNF
ncbi:hypothetical protein EGW08_018095, partial [Elysia chlorotica]